MYELSKEQKAWAHKYMAQIFIYHLCRSEYYFWKIVNDKKTTSLKTVFFIEQFIGIFFSYCHKLKISDEVADALCVYFRNEVLPTLVF